MTVKTDISSKELIRSLRGEMADIKNAIKDDKQARQWAGLIDLEARLEVIDYIIKCVIPPMVKKS